MGLATRRRRLNGAAVFGLIRRIVDRAPLPLRRREVSRASRARSRTHIVLSPHYGGSEPSRESDVRKRTSHTSSDVILIG
jgi:hypothetical protein